MEEEGPPLPPPNRDIREVRVAAGALCFSTRGELFALRAVLEELAGRMVPVDMGRPPSIRSILLFQLQDRPRRRHPSGVSGGPFISCRFSSVSFGPLHSGDFSDLARIYS